MLSKNIHTFLDCDADYDEARAVLFGAPYDSTTSFMPGTRFASAAMRNASVYLENYSPYQDRELQQAKIFDSGDLELPFGDNEAALKLIEERVVIILTDKKLPVMIGGEHLVTLAAIRALGQHQPELEIIHFDAHADLLDEYLGVRLSHGSVMRRCGELLGAGRIHQFGIRSGTRAEFALAATGFTNLTKFDFSGLTDTLAHLAGKPVYLSIDLDVLDPSVLPGTGTPEAGGVSFQALLEAILSVCQNTNVVGCDLVELCPPADTSNASTLTACKLLRELLLALPTKED